MTPSTSNRLSTVTTGSAVRSFSYASNGSIGTDVRTGSSTYGFSYNNAARLSTATLNSSTVGSYTYNALEQRAAKTASSATTQFVYDSAGHLIEEANASTGAAIREYIWQDDLPVALIDDSGASPVLYYIHADHLNRPQKITNSSKSVVWDGAFDPFGNVASLTSSITNPLRFPGQYADSETALNQNWYRDYDPSIGRYIESDPVGLTAGTNLFAYARQDPVSETDPSGRIGPTDPDDPWAEFPPELAEALMHMLRHAVPTQPCPDPDCPRLEKQIQDHIKAMEISYHDMFVDPLDLFNKAYDRNPGGALAGKGYWLGHAQRFQGLVTGLNRMVDDARKKHCRIPPEAAKWLGMNAPTVPGTP